MCVCVCMCECGHMWTTAARESQKTIYVLTDTFYPVWNTVSQWLWLRGPIPLARESLESLLSLSLKGSSWPEHGKHRPKPGKHMLISFTFLSLDKLLDYMPKTSHQGLFYYLAADSFLRLTTKVWLSKYQDSILKIQYFDWPN